MVSNICKEFDGLSKSIEQIKARREGVMRQILKNENEEGKEKLIKNDPNFFLRLFFLQSAGKKFLRIFLARYGSIWRIFPPIF